MNPKANHGLFSAISQTLTEEKSSLRLLKTHEHPSGATAKVYKDAEWGEHRVKFFDKDGKHQDKADYHCDDAEDAHNTAQAGLKRMNESLNIENPDYADPVHDHMRKHMDLSLAAGILKDHGIEHEHVDALAMHHYAAAESHSGSYMDTARAAEKVAPERAATHADHMHQQFRRIEFEQQKRLGR